MSAQAVLITVRDEPGVLFALTKVFAERHANVTHLDLHPKTPTPDIYFEFTAPRERCRGFSTNCARRRAWWRSSRRRR